MALLAVSAANVWVSYDNFPYQRERCHNGTLTDYSTWDTLSQDVAYATSAISLAGSVVFVLCWAASKAVRKRQKRRAAAAAELLTLDAVKYAAGLTTAFSFVASGAVYTLYLSGTQQTSEGCDLGVGLHYLALAGGAIVVVLLNHQNSFVSKLLDWMG